MFFDSGSFGETKISMEMFREFAGSITNDYLNSGIEPTASLCKIAQSEELTPHQVEVLAGEVNKLIHAKKYASADQKYFAANFPLADSKEVLSRLQVGGSTKVASFRAPDPVFETQDLDLHSAWGVKPEIMDKTASFKHEFKAAEEKTSLLSQKVGDQAILSKYAAEAAERKFVKEARKVVIPEPNSAERMKALGFLDHFVKSAGMSFARPALAKVAFVLVKEGLLDKAQGEQAIGYLMSKEADVKAPEEMISPWLNAKVVNGEHPLYITLKTFRNYSERSDECDSKHTIVDDKLRIIRQKIRAL